MNEELKTKRACCNLREQVCVYQIEREEPHVMTNISAVILHPQGAHLVLVPRLFPADSSQLEKGDRLKDFKLSAGETQQFRDRLPHRTVVNNLIKSVAVPMKISKPTHIVKVNPSACVSMTCEVTTDQENSHTMADTGILLLQLAFLLGKELSHFSFRTNLARWPFGSPAPAASNCIPGSS